MPPRGRRAAVLGSPISHSLSPVLHRAAYASLGLDWRYDAIDVADTASLRTVLDRCDADGDWAGLSLTMPLKTLVVPLLDEVSDTAAATGAVNTVVFTDCGSAADVGALAAAGARPRRVGHNTDVAGVVRAVREAGVDSVDEAVVLGGGATACSAVAALALLGARRAHVVVRSPGRAAEVVSTGDRVGVPVTLLTWPDSSRVGSASDRWPLATSSPLVVSTVPAQASAEAVQLLAGVDAAGSLLLDVAYHPWPTPLAQTWRDRGGTSVGGFAMLLHQAVEQVRLMTGRVPDVEAMRHAGAAALERRG